MNEVIYHIPLSLLPEYPTQPLIIRTDDPAALVAALATEEPERIVAAQLLSSHTDSEVLNASASGLQLELVLTDPATEFPLLYRHTNLLDNHLVRVVIPVKSGFGKAVKVAVSLDFAVRLEVGQPDEALIDELAEVLRFYLHQTTVSQPIEFFHGTLLGFFHEDSIPLWGILDEDPRFLRYIAEDGTESLYGRLAGLDAAIAPDLEAERLMNEILAVAEECRSCPFLESCGGYFKWSRSDYDCVGVKRLLGTLQEAAIELRQDVEVASQTALLPPS